MAALVQVAPGIHRYADGLVSWYVVEDGPLTLIDCGWPRSWPRIVAALGELGRRPGDVAAIVLTHGHADHLGAAEDARRATGATVHVHRPEQPRVEGRLPGGSSLAMVPALLPQLWRPAALQFVAHAAAHGFMTPTWVTTTRAHDAGEPLDVPGRPRFISTPGHTEGHASILLAEHNVLFTGDALVGTDPLTRRPGPRVPPPPLNTDTREAYRSLDALAQVEADLVLFGHGQPWTHGARAAAEAARAR